MFHVEHNKPHYDKIKIYFSGQSLLFMNCKQKDVRFLDPDIMEVIKEVGDYKEVTLILNIFARAVYVSVKDSELLHPAEELKNRLLYNTVNKFLY